MPYGRYGKKTKGSGKGKQSYLSGSKNPSKRKGGKKKK